MDYFNEGDLIVIQKKNRISRKYHYKLGTIISWSVDNTYLVKVDYNGKEITLKANEMVKA